MLKVRSELKPRSSPVQAQFKTTSRSEASLGCGLTAVRERLDMRTLHPLDTLSFMHTFGLPVREPRLVQRRV